MRKHVVVKPVRIRWDFLIQFESLQVSFTGGETIHPVLASSSIAGIASYTFFMGPMREYLYTSSPYNNG